MNNLERLMDMINAERDLDEFTDDLRRRFAEFKVFWRRMTIEKPDIYPITLSKPDWTEQFLVWLGAQE